MAVDKKRRSRAYEIMNASPQERMHLDDGSETNRRATAYAIMNQNTRDQRDKEQKQLRALAEQRAKEEEEKHSTALNNLGNLAYRAAEVGTKLTSTQSFSDKLSKKAAENLSSRKYSESYSYRDSNQRAVLNSEDKKRINQDTLLKIENSDWRKFAASQAGKSSAKRDLENLGITEESDATRQVENIYGENAVVNAEKALKNKVAKSADDIKNMSVDELKNFTPSNKEEAEAYLQRVQEINKEYAIAQSKGTVDENGMPKRVNESNVDIGGKDSELTMMSIENAYKYGVELDDGQIKAYEDLKERQENEKFSISSSKNLMKEALDTDYDNYTESFKEKSVSEKLDDAFADVNSAIGGLGESAWSAITSFAGSVAKPLYEALNFITVDTFGTGKFAEWAEDVSNYEEKTHNDALEANKEVFSDEAAEYVTMFEEAAAQAIPNVAMAILTGGASGAVTSESLMANATRNISGSTLKNTALTVVEGIKQYMKNPMFTTTFISEAGEAYEDAIENGADNVTALYNAFTVGLLNGLIEMGGGLETGETNFLKDALDEGMEEVWQGSVSNLMAKATYAPDMPLVSTDGSEAVINVKDFVLSFLGGAVGGAAGGGIVTGMNYAANPVTSSLQNRVYGDTLKTDTNTLSQYAQIALEQGSKRDVNTANEIMLAIQNGTLDEVSSIKVGKFAQNAAKLYQNKYIAAIAQDETGTSIKERTKSATEIYNTLQNIYTNPEFILNDTRAVMIRRNKVAAEALSRSAGLNSTINAQTPVSTVKTIARMVSNGVNVNNSQSINVDSTGRVSSTVTPAQIDVNAAQRIKNGNGSLSDYLSVTGKTLDDYRDSTGEVNADTLRREAHEIAQNSGNLIDDNSALSEISNSRRILNNIQNGSSQPQNGVEIENISGMRSVSPQNIVEIKDGDLTLDNGRTVSAESAPLTNDAQALYTASARYKDNAVATALINGYDGYGGLDVETYVKNFDGVYNVYKAQGGVKLTEEFRDKSTEAFKSRMGAKAYNAAKQAGIEARNKREAAKSRQNERKAAEPKNNEGKKKSSQKGSERGLRANEKSAVRTANNAKTTIKINAEKGLGLNKHNQLNIVKSLAKQYNDRGISVDIINDTSLQANGYYKNGTITVNMAANNPLSAFFHETSHMVKQYSGEYWNDISLMCITYLAKTKKTSISELADIKKKLYQTENEEFVNEELVSDAVSLIAQDKQAVRKLYNSLSENNTPKSRIQKILDKFKEVLMRLRTHFIKLGKSFNSNVEAVGMNEIRGFSSYVNELSEGISTAINELEIYGEVGGDTKYSIKYDVDNRPYVVIDEDILEGVNIKDIRAVREKVVSTIFDKFSNGIEVAGKTIKVSSKTRSEITRLKSTEAYIKRNRDVFLDKMRATNNLDEIVWGSRDYVNEGLKHNRKDSIDSFGRGKIQLDVNGKEYSADVIIGHTKNNSLLFYDIINLTPTKIKRRTDPLAVYRKNESTGTKISSSNNNISQNETVVNDSISENSENNTNKFYTIASNSKYAGVGEYNHFSLSVVKRLIKEGQRFRKEYESYTQFAYSNEYDQYSLLEHQFVGIGFGNPDIDANSLTVKKYLRIGEPKVENLTYLNSYNNAEDKREDGVSVITSGWLKSLKSVFFGSSNEKLASRGVYEIEGIDLNFLGGDDEVLIYPVSWAKKTNIKSRKKLEAAVKYLEESQNSEQDTKFSLKEDTTNWKPITPTAETQKVLNRLANNEHVSLETIQMLEEIREAYTRRGDYEPTVNINTPSRQELRRKIQDDVEKLGSARLDENGEWVYDNNIRKEKRIDVVIGLPAAGKSSAIADPLSNRYGSRIVDCDIVKERLPEFNNGYGSDAVHKESKLINDNILNRAMENGENIVLPIVGSGYNKLEQKLQSYKDRGYNVHLHLNELPMNKSLGRMVNRFLETGRFLDPSLPYEYQDKPTKVFNRIIAERGDLLNGYSHYSNDVKRGEKPIFIKGTERVEKTIDTGGNKSNQQKELAATPRSGRGVHELDKSLPAHINQIEKYSLMEDVDIKAAQAAIKANQELEKQVKLAGKLFKKAGTVLDYKSVQKISNELLRKYRFSGDTDMRNYITEKLYAFYTYATSEDADDGSAYAYAREIGEDIEKVNGVDIESAKFGEEMSDIIALDISSKYTETAILKSPEEYTKETDRLRESLRQEKAKANKNDEAILKLTKDLKTAVSNFHSAVETKQKYKSEVYELKRKLVQTENKLAKQKQSYEKKIAKLRSNKSKKKSSAVEQLRPPQKKFRDLDTMQLVAEHGAYEQNEGSSRDIFVPKKDKQGKVISKSVKTVVESDYVSDSAVSAINHAMLEGAMSHEVKTNKSAQKAADRIFERQGYEGAYKEFVSRIELSKEFANNGPDMVALGARLLQEAKERGDDTAAADITANLAVYALLGGRVTQSYNMIKACGATGQALFFERFVKNRNIANEKEWAKKWSVNAKEKYLGKTSEFKPLVLNEELMKKLVVATEQEDIDNISTAIMLDIADQVPSTAGEKIQAWRYFSMLSSPTTHIRNIVGNAVFATVRQGQNVIKTGLEQALNKASNGKVKLTTSIVVGKEYRDFAKSDWKKSQKTAMMSGKFNLENFITQNKKLYKHKIFNATIEKAIKWNSNMLEKEDGIFMKLAYTQALGRYLQANNISLEENSNAELEAERQRQLAEARANAFMEAQVATFRESSALATALTQLSNKNAASNLLVNSVMPFKKTPANIFIQSMRYSPIGIGMAVKQIVWDGVKGQKTANEIIDTLASGLTGTGIFLLGMLLRKLGILQGLFGDDDILNDEQGLQENSITICGYTFTIDWSAPMVVPLMMGAEWADSFGGFKIDGKFTDNAWQLVSQSVDPLINMTMLEGVNDILTSIKYSQDNAISDIAIKTGTNFISQFVPTIGGKIAQTVSDSRKRTYIDKDKSETLQTVVQGVQKKTPVWYDSLQPYLDAWGQEDKENVASKILQNFVLPGYLQKVESDTATDLVLEVYEQSGHDKTVVPKTPAKYFTMYELEKVDGKEKSVKGEKINLTGEQYTTLARTQGNMSHALVTALADNSTFNNMDISQKVAVLDNVYDFAKYLGRYAVDNNYSGTSTEKWCRELVNSKKKKTEEQIINTILKRNKE